MADEKKVVLLEIDINVESAIEANKELLGQVIGLEKEARKLAETDGTLSDAYIKNAAELKNAKAELAANERMIRKTIEANNAASGSIDQMSAQLSVVNSKWKALSEEERNNTERGRELSAQKKELTEKINAERMALSDTTANVGNYAESIKSLKLELRENTLELVKMKAAGLDGTPEYKERLKLTGEMADTIADTREEIKKYASDTMALDQTIGVLKGVGAAAQVVQGATALLGTENENLTKSIQGMVAVQGMMSGAQEIGNALQKESAFMMGVMSVKTGIVTAAQWLWNAAMTANPIGAIVTGVTALIALFGGLALVVNSNTDELDKQKKAVEELEGSYVELQDALALESKIVEALGLTEEEKAIKSRKAIRDQINALELLNEALYKQRALEGDNEELNKKIADNNAKIISLGDELIISKLSQQKRGIDATKKLADEELKYWEDYYKKLDELNLKYRVSAAIEAENLRSQSLLTLKSDVDSRLITVKDQATAELDIMISKLAEEQAIKDEASTVDAERIANDALIYQQSVDAKKKLAEEEANARIVASGAVGNALSALGDLAGEKTAEGKALAVAGATMNAYSGIAATLGAPTTIPEPFGTISKIANSVTIGAAAFKAVKSILAVKIPGGKGGGGGGSLSGGSGTTSVPRASYNPEIGKGLVSRNNATGTQSSVASGVQQGINASPVQPVVVVDSVTEKQNAMRKNLKIATY